MIEIERGKGVYLYDPKGKAYLDLISGIGVSGLGHCHPLIVEAIQKQSERYLHTMVYGEYVMSPQVELATLLAKVLPDPLDSVYFVNSGTEATEGAMKLAKRYTGRSEIISCYKAYHGSTQGPGISHIDFNCDFCLHKITKKTAAVIVETVQGEWGVRPPINDYLKKLRARCTETGTLLILDEIQAGYGRTGSLFAFEQYGIVPDILLLAKGMGGGMPIGAFVATKKIMQVFSVNPLLGHITTFGGHPVSCAAALATLQHLLESDYISKVKEKEALFKKLLVHPSIIDVRSAGLMMAVELRDFDFVQAVIKDCLEEGLIIDWFLFNDRSLRIAPPLIITASEIEHACTIILKAIDRNKKEAIKTSP